MGPRVPWTLKLKAAAVAAAVATARTRQHFGGRTALTKPAPDLPELRLSATKIMITKRSTNGAPRAAPSSALVALLKKLKSHSCHIHTQGQRLSVPLYRYIHTRIARTKILLENYKSNTC